MHSNNGSGCVELARIIMAKKMGIPPDNIDMSAIFRCAQRAVEEKVENNLDEYILAPANDRELKAVVGLIGETIVPLMFNHEYPFDDILKDYEQWYKENLAVQFLKMKIQSIRDDKGD